MRMKRSPTRHLTLAGVILAALIVALTPSTLAAAAGPIWLPAAQATHASFDNLQPVVATYRDHAYILTSRSSGGDALGVYFSTNESGTWTTRQLSPKGPPSSVQDFRTTLAVDTATRKLYAAWVYSRSGHETLGVWTRDPSGAWSGPVDIATSEVFLGPPSIIAAGGKIYVAYAQGADPSTASCHKERGDVFVASYDGTAWSTAQDLTNCVARDYLQDFHDAKIAADESGRLYLVVGGWDRTGQLWYLENIAGSWSRPASLVRGWNDTGPGGVDRGDYYSIAASNGTAYVAYAAKGRPPTPSSYGYREIVLATRSPGGSWAVRQLTSDPHHCSKYAPWVAATGGRIAIAYVFDFGENCYSSPPTNADAGVHMLTGASNALQEAPRTPNLSNTCGRPALSVDGNVFRLAALCRRAGDQHDDVYYTPQFFDIVGPTITRLAVPSTATAPGVPLSWAAQDPTPGSGVAYYEVQVKEDSGAGAFRDIVAAPRSTRLTYTETHAGRRYTFRVRARDRVNNWGSWRFASTSASS